MSDSTTERLAKGTSVKFTFMQRETVGTIEGFSDFSGHYRIAFTEPDIDGKPEVNYTNREREQFTVIGDTAKFIMYDAPIGPDPSLDWIHDPKNWEFTQADWDDINALAGEWLAKMQPPAASVIKQPLSDLEALTASIRRIKRTLETTPPLPDQVGILIEIIDTAYAECLNALDTLGVQS